jgi:hypothetical protein
MKKLEAFTKIWDYLFMYIICTISIISVVKHWDEQEPTRRLLASLTTVICCGFITVYRKIDTVFDEKDIKETSEEI